MHDWIPEINCRQRTSMIRRPMLDEKKPFWYTITFIVGDDDSKKH